MSGPTSERGQSFEDDVDAVDRGLFTGNPRLEFEEEDERCILDNSGGGEVEVGIPTSLAVPSTGHGDEVSVDSIQVYHDNPTSDATLICRVFDREKPQLDKLARNQLVAVSIFCSLFIVGEIVGGVLSNSVAILTDAVHLASDLTSFIISLFAIHMAVKKPSSKYTFGLYRAEVVGATISILSIWLVTGVLSYLAVERIIHQNFVIQSDDMLITAAICVVFNVIMAVVLNVRACNCSLPHASFGHSHGNHAHGNHSHNNRINQYTQLSDHSPTRDDGDGHGHGHGHGSPGHGSHGDHTNINVKAAFIHVIGDLIQSIGILIAAIIIKIRPDYKLADPICTLLFAVMVLFTTVYMLRDIFSVVLEATPRSINYTEVCADLRALTGVKIVSSLQIWSLTLHKTAASAHLAVALGVDYDLTVAKATHLLRTKYEVTFTTIQVMTYRPEMTSSMSDSSELQLSEPI